MTKTLSQPEAVRELLRQRYIRQQGAWLTGDGVWPLTIALGSPIERDAAAEPAAVRAWADTWAKWEGPGTVTFEERRWAKLGPQRIPVVLTLDRPADVATIVGEGARWGRAVTRYAELASRWPALAGPTLARQFEVLADYDHAAMSRLAALLEWLEENPASGLYLRQLPVEGIDTKWVEQRRGLVADLLRALRPELREADFLALCGLERTPHRVRLRLLDGGLAETTGGLRDIEAPIAEVAALALAPRAVVIVENLETGLALPDLPGTVAFMKLGHGVTVLRDIPWIAGVPAIYWGDVDTHGFAILEKARNALPHLVSVLMDAQTLLANRMRWGSERSPYPEAELPRLTASERDVYRGLRENRWAERVRLEQERIPWRAAVAALRGAIT